MLTIISGTNRPDSVTLRVARAAAARLDAARAPHELLDLAQLPTEIFAPSSYATKPDAFAPWQQSILESDGLLFVVPEYNGSFPGVLKYFIDMLEFPASLAAKPVAFIGLAAGHFGAARAVEQLTAVVQYRSAHVYGRRLFIHGSYRLAVDGASLGHDEFQGRFDALVDGFRDFCRRLAD